MQAVGAFPVCGIIDMKNPNLNNVSVFMSLPTAQDFLSANDLMTHLIINKKEYSDEQSIVSSLSKNFKEGYEIMSWQEMMPEIEQVIKADSAGGLVMIFIFFNLLHFFIKTDFFFLIIFTPIFFRLFISLLIIFVSILSIVKFFFANKAPAII